MQTIDIDDKQSVLSGAANDELSLLELLIVLARRKRFILRCMLCAAATAALACLLLPNKYTAETSLLPPQQGSSLSAALMSQLGNLGALGSIGGKELGLKNPNDLYVTMLRSRTVEDAMIRRFGLMDEYHAKRMSEARRRFESSSRVESNPKDGLILISVENSSPTRAAELANGYVAEFRNFSASLAITEASQRRLFFERQLAEANQNLAKAEEALKQTQETTGLIQIDSQARALIESAASLRAQVTAKEVQIQAMHSFATDDNPELVMARNQLSALQQQLHQLTGTGSDTESDLFVPKGKVPEAGLEYLRKYRDVKYQETVFQLLARQFEVAKIDEARQGAIIQVVDLAVPPDRRSFPKPSLILPGAVGCAFILAVFWVLLAEGVSRASRHQDEQQRLLVLRQLLSWKK